MFRPPPNHFESCPADELTPAGGAPQATTRSLGALHSFGVLLLCSYIFLVYTRTPEILAGAIGTSFKIASLTLGAVMLLSLFGGRLWQALTTREGLLMLACTMCFLLSIPFSVWKGGSTGIFTSFWLISLLLFIAVISVLATVEDCRYVMYTLTLGLLTICAYLWIWGSSAGGRLALGGSATLVNPNLLAMHLEFGLPFCFLLPMRYGIMGLRGLVGVAIGLISLTSILRTGSRAAVLGLGIMLFLWFWQATPGVKMALLAALILMGVGAAIVMPQNALSRYRALFDADTVDVSDPELQSAYESSTARREHLRQSIKLTVENPFLGVGLGMFTVASSELSAEEHKKAAWRETHNTFTQVSSEAGLPAFLLYVLLVGSSVKSVHSLYRATRSRPHLASISQMSLCLLLALAGAITNAMFASVAYQIYFPLLAGLSAVFVRSARQEVGVLESEAAGQQTAVSRSEERHGATAEPGGSVDRGGSNPGKPRTVSHL
jgi:O-antigen ligase